MPWTLVEDAAKRIWTPEGRIALAYLRRRGLTDETIRQARLGWTPKVSIPVKDGIRYWRVSGIVIPWVDRGRLAMVKIRRRTGEEPKYAEALPRPPFDLSDARGRPPWEAAGDRGRGIRRALARSGPRGAGRRRDPRFGIGPPRGIDLPGDAGRPRWYLGTDADDAGDKAASGWPARAVRVEPPSGKDWTEAAQAGVDLRRWWTDRLGGIEAAPPDPAPWKVSPAGDVERDEQTPSETAGPRRLDAVAAPAR